MDSRSIVAVLAVLAAPAHAGLTEQEVLLLYNATDPESAAIADAYLAARPGVHRLNLPLAYQAVDCSKPTPLDAVDRFHVSPRVFYDEIAVPVQAYLAAHPGILALVTTRGLPAAIRDDFCSEPPGSLIASVESMLARLGTVDGVASLRDGLDQPMANPYAETLGLEFRAFLADSCPNGGASWSGKMFLASRLDSNPVNGTHLEGVLDLIERSRRLEVNKFGVTIVVDSRGGCGLVARDVAAANSMCGLGWPTYVDDGTAFLHGANLAVGTGCGELTIESAYDAYPELVHATPGQHHNDGYCGAGETDHVCWQYVHDYLPHPAGFFTSVESFNGYNIQGVASFAGQGQVLDWIAAGGSFTCGTIEEPGFWGVTHADYVVVNLYHHGLSWGEAIYTSVPSLGSRSTPIGDPLATVVVYDPDVTGDGKVNEADEAFVESHWGACLQDPCPGDIDRDGVVDGRDIKRIEECFGRDVSGTVCAYTLAAHRADCLGGVGRWLCSGDVSNDARITQTDRDLVLSVLGCRCPDADIDGNGIVDAADLALIAPPDRYIGDLNGDGVVDCEDDRLVTNLDCHGDVDNLDRAALWLGRGDLNDDGRIDCDDLAAIVAHESSTHPYEAKYDIDCDGVVEASGNGSDYQRLKNVAGLDACP